jgi:hypothetical protein
VDRSSSCKLDKQWFYQHCHGRQPNLAFPVRSHERRCHRVRQAQQRREVDFLHHTGQETGGPRTYTTKLPKFGLQDRLWALALRKRNQVLYGKLLRASRATENESEMCNGRQCLWYIYAHFALPGMEADGLKITFAVIDLTAIKLIGGDLGLGNFWSRWCDCMARVTDNPARSTCRHLFVGGIRKSKMMNMYVRDYDDLERNRVGRTWGHLVKKRRACFERARLRDNHIRTLGILSGKPHPQAAVDMAVPGVAYVPQGGQGQGPLAFPRPPNAFVDLGNWPGAMPRPQRQRWQIQRTPE